MTLAANLFLVLLTLHSLSVGFASGLPRDRRLASRNELSATEEAASAVRGLLQTQGTPECGLEADEIEGLLDPDSRVWLLDGDALSEFDLQDVVDCTQEGDVLLFDVEDAVKPTERVVIPWNLTLSGVVDDTDLEKGVFPESESKVRITCPEDDVGVFSVESADVLFANIVFENCSLTGTEASSIVEVGSCGSDEESGTVRFHHVDFSKNSLAGASGLNVSAEGCSSVEMIDVGFDENECGGSCGARLSAEGNILTNLRITNNTARNYTSEPSSVVYCAPDSTTRAENILASGNEMPGFHVDNATLDIRDSSFKGNEIPAGSTSTFCIYLRNSDAEIKNCEFEDNSGEGGGSAVLAISCGSVRITDCGFLRNNASGLEGGAVFSNGTESLKIKGSSFTDNVGADGAAAYLEDTKSDFADCVFDGNNASANGGGIHVKGSKISISECTFTQNGAVADGGGVFADGSETTFANVTCLANGADNGGCIRIINNTVVLITDSLFEGNTVIGTGGGVVSSDSIEVVVQKSDFINNSGEYSGGLGLKRYTLAIITDCVFKGNNATENAGGLFLENGTSIVSNCVFEDNIAGGFGGGLDCFNRSMAVSDSQFYRNRAGGGAGVILVGGCVATFDNIVWEDNAGSDNYGGALQIYESAGTVQNSVVKGNSAAWGGGIFVDNGNGTCSNVTFAKNRGEEYGGGLATRNSTVNVTGSHFEENVCDQGGAIYLGLRSNGKIFNSSVVSNAATSNGGGVVATGGSGASITRSSFVSNYALGSYGGGCFYFDGGYLTMDEVQIISSSSAGGGGGLLAFDTNTSISNSMFDDNRAGGHGGGIGMVGGRLNVSNCSIVRSESEGSGGGIYTGDAVIGIKDTNITFSYATGSGGGIISLNCSLTADNIILARNTAVDSGGCLEAPELGSFVFTNSSFIYCSAEFGGAVDIKEDASGELISCYGQGNSVDRSGGFAYVGNANLTIIGGEFLENKAKNGGYIYATSSNLVIQDVNITDNYAAEDGGGICSENSTLTADNVLLLRNEAKASGGCFDVPEYGSFVFTNSVFNHCRAEFGAAVDIYKDVSGSLLACSGYNNSALASGGMAYVQQADLTIIGGEFVENKASFGAGIYLAKGRLLMNKSVFSGGYASGLGGAINSDDGSYIVVHDVLLRDNEADYGGSLCTRETYTWANNLQVSGSRAKVDGGGLYAYDDSSFLCTGCYFKNNSANGNGGGVHLDSEVPQLLAYQFDNTTFELNRAKLGGGINFVSQVGSKNCSDPEETCTLMALRGTAFRDNDASVAGGGIMSRDLNSVRLSCSYDPPEDPLAFLTREKFERLPVFASADQFCNDWRDNKAKGYGQDIGTYVRGIKKFIQTSTEDDEREEVEQNFYVILDHKSGTPLPALFFEAVDQLGQGPAISSGSALAARMWSPHGLFSGFNEVSFADGNANFTNITPFQAAGLYEVVVDFNDTSIPSFTMVVRIRNCTIGEALAAKGTLCQECSADTYNFNPDDSDSRCKRCPENANCTSRFIRPIHGYWHQTPCSSHIKPCLSERSCNDGERDIKMENLTTSLTDCNFTNNAFIRNYTDAQCRKGYKGPLCGSCENSYGRSRAFRCEPCFSLTGNYILVALVVCVLLGLSGFAIRSSLPTHKRRRRRNRRERRSGPPSESVDSSSDLPRRNGQQVIEMAHSGRPSSRSIRSTMEAEAPPGPSVDPEKIKELAKWKAVEIFKITINYLQVIAIAVSVNANWSEALIAAFETAEFVGGVTSEAATRSVDCLVSDDSAISRSAVRTIVSILVPLAVTGFWAVFWAAAMYCYQEAMRYLSKRSILSICAVSYLSYIAITKTAVNVLYCVDVYDSLDSDSDSTHKYWAVDTQLKCYEGNHAVLAGVVGWPVVILFSFGFPVTIATMLVNIRNKHGMQSEWLYESAGFLYRAYSSEYVFWESVIMLRKAVLVVVVVFAYPLGGNLQGVLAVCVLMVASYFHVLCSPFRDEFDDLNQFEGLSLLVSSLTFVSGLFFNDDHTSDAARILLTVFLFIANIGIFGFFFVSFLRSASRYLKTLMDDEGLSYNQDGNAIHKAQSSGLALNVSKPQKPFDICRYKKRNIFNCHLI